MSDDLEPLAPESAVELYLDQRSDEVSASTHESHEYRLAPFVEWCEEVEGITNMNELSGRDLHAYRVWRREEGDLKPVTLQGQLSTLRVFLGFCASIDAVEESLRSKILLPTVSGDDEVSETTLDPARAEAMLDYLGRYQYASRAHVTALLLWRTGMRTGSVRSLDLDDLDLEEGAAHVVHSPETDTPLKNGNRGERWVALSPDTAQTVQDYIDGPREAVTDDYGCDPLLTTREGRVSRSTVRDTMYRWTRPCVVGEGCPHDRDPDDCEAAQFDGASKCPSSRSPHDVRSGAITSYLLNDTPAEIVGDRMDVSKKVLDRHYDRRTQREKMEQRRDYLPDDR
ncbi:tyrosine-type recombinase/integrase [Halosegnis longus]|uniref:tyrosine-type recombinase/integrase n=1 Tax=Halosegnis longus TaxID=2216012 RepID=UPI001561E9D4|nr:tyrosine-type recombinase/integrase [Halosegnis longus]